MRDERGAGLAVTADDVETPSGRNSASTSAIQTLLAGVVSDGFRTMQLPAASAGAHFQTPIIAG